MEVQTLLLPSHTVG